MKKILTILFILSLSSCYVYRSGYVNTNPKRQIDTYWDPIYYSYPFYRFNSDPWYRDQWSDQRLDNLYYYRRNGNNFLYNPYYGRQRPVIIYREKERPAPQPQRPRVDNFKPSTRPSIPRQSPKSAPIREFPKK